MEAQRRAMELLRKLKALGSDHQAINTLCVQIQVQQALDPGALHLEDAEPFPNPQLLFDEIIPLFSKHTQPRVIPSMCSAILTGALGDRQPRRRQCGAHASLVRSVILDCRYYSKGTLQCPWTLEP